MNKATFKNHGGGNHTMDIPGVGGAQALSTEGPTGNTLYDVTVWNADNDIVDKMNSFTTLNEAKSYAKDALRGNIMERVYR